MNGPQADADLPRLPYGWASDPMRILRTLARKDARMCSHTLTSYRLLSPRLGLNICAFPEERRPVKANEKRPAGLYCIVPSALRRFKDLLNAL